MNEVKAFWWIWYKEVTCMLYWLYLFDCCV